MIIDTLWAYIHIYIYTYIYIHITWDIFLDRTCKQRYDLSGDLLKVILYFLTVEPHYFDKDIIELNGLWKRSIFHGDVKLPSGNLT